MFTPGERSRIRRELLDRAAADPRITGAAITGSAAADQEDRWSDIDLAFGIKEDQRANVIDDWTAAIYQEYSALHHVDVPFGAWLYRVFLLASTMQVDLAFAPEQQFGALSPTFRLTFGKANQLRQSPPKNGGELLGLAWLYALHARSALGRGKLWQAEYMISGVRDNVLALACLRRDLPIVHGRGVDLLPTSVTTGLRKALVRQLDGRELRRAFRVVIQELLRETDQMDPVLAAKLRLPLLSLGVPGRREKP